MNFNKIIIISGPTATGKTQTSLNIAQRYGGATKFNIVNFDSLLFYRELSIGTAKPSEEECSLIPHHLINIASIKKPLNAFEFASLAEKRINDLFQQNICPILVGGSGFYLRALTEGMYPSLTSPQSIIDRSQELYDQSGITPFREILKEVDPLTYTKYHENDHYRIRRAIEHFWTTAIPLSKSHQELEDKKIKSHTPSQNWKSLHIHLDVPKEDHEEIILRRAKQMLSQGLIEEVKSLLKQGFSGKEKPMQSIGYKEVISFLEGTIKNTEELLEQIKISTRQLAKSQRTWFKKIDGKINFNPLQDNQMIYQAIDQFWSR